MPNYKKTCPECGNTFIGVRTKIVCSDACRQSKSRRPRKVDDLLMKVSLDIGRLKQLAETHPELKNKVIMSLRVIERFADEAIRDTAGDALHRNAEGVTPKCDTPACHTSPGRD